MTRNAWGAGALLLLTASTAGAGALDRSGQPVTVLLEQGNYAELSFGLTRPEVQGSFAYPGRGPVASSGNVGVGFDQLALALKYDVTNRASVPVILDQPFGADVDYGEADALYPLGGSVAEFRSSAFTALGRYRFDDSFSIHAGARLVRVDADLVIRSLTPTGALTYDAAFDTDSDVGFVVGGAYEREEIGLRVALTYSSETSFAHRTDFTGSVPVAPGVAAPIGGSELTEYTLPQSVNLDFRTGIAPDTALFGSIRWADWSETEINVPGYSGAPVNGGAVVDYDEDIFTYTLGVGRRFNDSLTASAAVIYEPQTGRSFDPATGLGGVANLAPTDGQLGLQLAATYAVTDNLEVTGAVRYTRLGGATTRRIGASFEDNDALTLGLRIGYRF